MATKLGMEAKLYRNTGTYESPVWVEVDNCKDLSLSLTKGEADVTTRANDGWRAFKKTLKEATVEFDMLWDSEDTNFAAFRTAWMEDSAIEVLVLDGDVETPGSEGLRATVEVGDFSVDQKLEEGIGVKVQLKPTVADNAPEWYTAA